MNKKIVNFDANLVFYKKILSTAHVSSLLFSLILFATVQSVTAHLIILPTK